MAAFYRHSFLRCVANLGLPQVSLAIKVGTRGLRLLKKVNTPELTELLCYNKKAIYGAVFNVINLAQLGSPTP